MCSISVLLNIYYPILAPSFALSLCFSLTSKCLNSFFFSHWERWVILHTVALCLTCVFLFVARQLMNLATDLCAQFVNNFFHSFTGGLIHTDEELIFFFVLAWWTGLNVGQVNSFLLQNTDNMFIYKCFIVLYNLKWFNLLYKNFWLYQVYCLFGLFQKDNISYKRIYIYIYSL